VSDPFAPTPPPYGAPPPPYGSPPPPYGAPPPTNGMATAALVIGIIAALAVFTLIGAFVAFVPGVTAVVLGILGLQRAGRTPDGRGRGLAIAGIVLGALATVASLVAFAVVAVFVASSDTALVGEQPAAVDDYELTDRTCEVEDGQAVASGILVNRSGQGHGFAVVTEFRDGTVPLGTRTTELESELEDGASWGWEVVLPVDVDQVDTDSLDCRVVRVEIGDVVSD